LSGGVETELTRPLVGELERLPVVPGAHEYGSSPIRQYPAGSTGRPEADARLESDDAWR
jgi:hypothetical protein